VPGCCCRGRPPAPPRHGPRCTQVRGDGVLPVGDDRRTTSARHSARGSTSGAGRRSARRRPRPSARGPEAARRSSGARASPARRRSAPPFPSCRDLQRAVVALVQPPVASHGKPAALATCRARSRADGTGQHRGVDDRQVEVMAPASSAPPRPLRAYLFSERSTSTQR